MEQKIDKEVFDTFFHESYCPVEYVYVKEEFERVASQGMDIFTEGKSIKEMNRKNFVLYLTNDAYCEFEAIVEESMDSLNSEIVDAVMDVSTTMDNEDEITGTYWKTCEELLRQFLGTLFDEVISKWEA